MGLAATNIRNKLLLYFQGAANPLGTPPANFYVALLTANPSDENGTGLAEVSTSVWTNYARPAIAASGGWSAITGTNPATISNAGIVDFGTATITSPVTVTGFALYDALTAGNFLAWATLTGGNQVVTTGNAVSYAVGALTLAI